MPYLVFDTAFGRCALAWNEAGLTGFRLPEEPGRSVTDGWEARGETAHWDGELPTMVTRTIQRAQDHLAGRWQDFSDTALDWSRASEFQRAVYLQTQAISAGRTRSYGDISRALALGAEGARAVGVALATNPWPLIVPCHRVVASDGRMTGFSAPGGIRTKTRLLALEGAELLSE